MERWCQTACHLEAAAFAHMGAEVKILTSLHERTATRQVRFNISTTTLDGRWQVDKIRHEMRAGTLQRSAPSHPYLTMRRAFAAREAILAMQKDGAFFRLVAVPGAPGIYQYLPGDQGLPGLAGQLAAVKTADIKIAAALVTAGFPLLRIEGAGSRHEYTLAGHPLGQPPGAVPEAARLVAAWRDQRASLRGDLPFVLAAGALEVREILRTEVSKSIDTVLLSKPGTKSHAAVRADASDKAWNTAVKFLSNR